MDIDTSFYDLSLVLTPGRVMRPRPATEALVACALQRVGSHRARIADVGTGSGALAIAIARGAPAAEVWATDVNPDAVELARENAARHGVTARLHVVEASLLDGVPHELDVVVANLPYLPERFRGTPKYAEYDDEPWCAIYAADDGLGHYRGLLEDAERHLATDGLLAIQLYGRVYSASRARLEELHATIDEHARLAA